LGNPLVSIVTPSLNQGSFIARAIESVLTQDYSPIEYLVMDGGSTDETLEVLKRYDERLSWVSERDQGQANAINKGWRRSRGEILAWLNSDDFYLPGAIPKVVAFLQEHPEAAAVYGEGFHVDAEERIIERYPTEPFDLQRLYEFCFICQPTVFIRRAVLEDVGFLDESLNFCMDYDFWFRIAKKHTFRYMKEPLACTRFYESTKTFERRIEAHKEILAVVFHHFGSVPPSWAYGYAYAKIRSYFHRQPNFGNLFFLGGIAFLIGSVFLKYNHRAFLAEGKRWGNWFCRNFHRSFFQPPRGPMGVYGLRRSLSKNHLGSGQKG
jgi:glycosyltransferase involved in cell wall biosynthesis